MKRPQPLPLSAPCLSGALVDQVQAMRRHLTQCREAQRPWSVLRMWAEEVNVRLAPRVVSMMVLGTTVIASLSALP